MKKIGEGYWNYKGHDVYLAENPKLSGKYEIYKVCDFISRAVTLTEAKEIINATPYPHLPDAGFVFSNNFF
jgi:hypothetical protein